MTRLYGRGWAAPPPRVESPRVESDGACADRCGDGAGLGAGELEQATVMIKVSAERTSGLVGMLGDAWSWRAAGPALL